LPEYKKQKDYKEFKDIKQHNRPFSLYLKEDLDGLIKLTEKYKEMYPDSNRSKSKTLSNEEPP
jgi:5-bromo-4-chloroindolyl phosphate hydrolysis protein